MQLPRPRSVRARRDHVPRHGSPDLSVLAGQGGRWRRPRPLTGHVLRSCRACSTAIDRGLPQGWSDLLAGVTGPAIRTAVVHTALLPSVLGDVSPRRRRPFVRPNARRGSRSSARLARQGAGCGEDLIRQLRVVDGACKDEAPTTAERQASAFCRRVALDLPGRIPTMVSIKGRRPAVKVQRKAGLFWRATSEASAA